MEGAGVATVAFAEPALRRERRAVEAEAENLGAAALLLRLDPGPGRMDDDEVAAERARRGGVGLRRSVRIVLQQRLRPLAEDRARQDRRKGASRRRPDASVKLKPSSLFQPAISGTSLCSPAAKISAGGRGRNHPSMIGRKPSPGAAARMASAGGARSSASERAPTLRMKSRPAASASSSDASARLGDANIAPLSPMTRANSPLASGEAISALAACEPADSPAIVTLSGSPPKAAMLRLTHCSAATRSRKP